MCTIVGWSACGDGVITAAANGTVAIGHQALNALTSGANNVAVGINALVANTTGHENTAVGRNSLDACDDGAGNTAMGESALTANVSSDNNSAFGANALGSCTGASNTAVGKSAGAAINSGAQNVCVGNNAGDAITSGGANTCIGNDSDAAATVANQIAIGNSAVTDGANKGRWGNSSVGTNNIQTDWTIDSDRRIKDDIKDSDLGLSFINLLKPRTFIKIHPADYPESILEKRYKSGGVNYDDDKNEIIRDEFEEKVWNGLIAQEVKESMDSLGVDFSGWGEEKNGKQGVTYSTIVMPLIKAVQELSQQVEDLKKQINK